MSIAIEAMNAAAANAAGTAFGQAAFGQAAFGMDGTASGILPGAMPGAAGTAHMPGLGQSGGAGAPPAPFSDLLTDAVGQVNQLESQAQTAVEGLMTGSGVDVHRAMIATEKADMAFELTLAVRNKAVAAYQQVMGMQF